MNEASDYHFCCTDLCPAASDNVSLLEVHDEFDVAKGFQTVDTII